SLAYPQGAFASGTLKGALARSTCEQRIAQSRCGDSPGKRCARAVAPELTISAREVAALVAVAPVQEIARLADRGSSSRWQWLCGSAARARPARLRPRLPQAAVRREAPCDWSWLPQHQRARRDRLGGRSTELAGPRQSRTPGIAGAEHPRGSSRGRS